MKPFLITLLLCIPTYAATDDNANAWFMYFGDHPIASSKWGIHLEGQWRRTDLGLQWQQYLLRPAVNYQLTKNVMLTGDTDLRSRIHTAISPPRPPHQSIVFTSRR